MQNFLFHSRDYPAISFFIWLGLTVLFVAYVGYRKTLERNREYYLMFIVLLMAIWPATLQYDWHDRLDWYAEDLGPKVDEKLAREFDNIYYGCNPTYVPFYYLIPGRIEPSGARMGTCGVSGIALRAWIVPHRTLAAMHAVYLAVMIGMVVRSYRRPSLEAV